MESGIQDLAQFLVHAHLPVLQEMTVAYVLEEDNNVGDDETLAALHLGILFTNQEQPCHQVMWSDSA
jgi:hypothetical protein